MIYIISSALGFMGFLFNYPLLFQIGGWLGVYYCVFNLLEIQGRKESSPTVIFHLIPFITGLLTFSIENMLIASIVVMAIGSVSQLIKSKSGLDTKASLIQKKVSENSTGLSETPDGSKYIPIDLGYKIGTIIGIIVWSSISFGISIGIWGVVFNKNFIYFFSLRHYFSNIIQFDICHPSID